MPTISEPVDEEIRQGKALSVLQHYAVGAHGPWTVRAALGILRYSREEIKDMMERVEIAVLRADVRMTTVYVCVGCRTRQAGTTAGGQFTCAQSLREFLDNPTQPVHAMPVGWSNHLDGFRCQQCTRATMRSVVGE